jgi:hypothetical protein
MKQNSLEKGRFVEHSQGLGTVTERMVQERARELAMINGRPAHQVLAADLEEARRELTERESMESSPTPEENLTEEERWDAIGESKMKRGETIQAADEQTFAEELVDEGVEEAEHDQMAEAAREKLPRDEA